MSEAKHTPEPWHVTGYLGNERPVQAVGISAQGGTEVIQPTFDDDLAEINFERMVACVNACEGLNPEAVPEIVKVARRYIAWQEMLFESAQEQGYKGPRGFWHSLITRDMEAALNKAKEGSE